MKKNDTIFQSLRDSFGEGRLAHAYIIEGSPRSGGLDFAIRLTQLVLCEKQAPQSCTCNVCRQVAQRIHPDVQWIEPQSKSRQIVVDDIDPVVRQINQTTLGGGWKAIVMLAADRMNAAAANKLLKTLEEPPGKTLILQVTDLPHALLPTIRSRCQRISLPEDDDAIPEETIAASLPILRKGFPMTVLGYSIYSSFLNSELEKLRNLVDEEDEEEAVSDVDKKVADARLNSRFIEARGAFLRFLMRWYRDVLILKFEPDAESVYFSGEIDYLRKQADKVAAADAIRHVQCFEEMARLLNRNLPQTEVFEQCLSCGPGLALGAGSSFPQ